MSPITPTILPRGSQAHRKKTLGYTKPQIPFFQPLLPLSLLPGRLWHCNKFLASVHVPELNIGKVALTAITNMGWVPLFFPVPPSVCVGRSLFKKPRSHSHVCQRRRAEKPCVCVYLVCMFVSVCACRSIQIDVGMRVCVTIV